MRGELDCHVDALFDRPASEGITLALVILGQTDSTVRDRLVARLRRIIAAL